jgi:hypothetical protein
MMIWDDIVDFHGMRRANQMINISLKDKYVWFVNPKVASSTLSASLQRLETRNTPGIKIRPHPELESAIHIKPYQLPLWRTEQILSGNELKMFVFVRNPYRRLASAYLDKIANNRPEKGSILKLLGLDPTNDIEKAVSFDQFIGVICDADPKNLDLHWMPQIYTTGAFWINHNFIGKFENFDDDLVHLQRMLKLDLMAHYNSFVPHKTTANEDWKDLFSKKSLRKKVIEYFAEDFARFNYSIEV